MSSSFKEKNNQNDQNAGDILNGFAINQSDQQSAILEQLQKYKDTMSKFLFDFVLLF